VIRYRAKPKESAPVKVIAYHLLGLAPLLREVKKPGGKRKDADALNRISPLP
jgi:hypothetical protein